MAAWKAGLIEHQGRGQYRARNSAASEQFFWEGAKAKDPRPYALWMEPIITVAGLGRLHLQYGWPTNLLGSQSRDWAFDLFAKHPEQDTDYLVCEVKKSRAEVDALLEWMIEWGRSPGADVPGKGSKGRNAYNKVKALRARQSSVFWALGPERYESVYRVSYEADGVVELVPADDTALSFSACCGASRES